MFTQGLTSRSPQLPGPEQIADMRLAVSKMTGATRRAFEAEMTLKYCSGNARQAESVFGWGRHTVELGLAERRTGIMCLGAQSTCSGQSSPKHPFHQCGNKPTLFRTASPS